MKNPIYRFFLVDRYNNQFVNFSSGELDTEDGSVTSSKTHQTSDFAEVDVHSCICAYGYTELCVYDENKEYINGIDSDVTGAPGYVILPETAKYIRASTENTHTDKVKIFVGKRSYPIYGQDLKKSYQKEENEQFFREKLEGDLFFVGSDFDYINSQDIEFEYGVVIFKSNDFKFYFGQPFSKYYDGKFAKTDCEFDADNKQVNVSVETIDEYNDILAGIENEYDLVRLAPEIESINYKKRPIIQVAIPGDSVVSCYWGGNFFEIDADVPDDENVLYNDYYFAKSLEYRNGYATVTRITEDAAGAYAGKIVYINKDHLSWELKNSNDYRLSCASTKVKENNYIHVINLYSPNGTQLFPQLRYEDVKFPSTITFRKDDVIVEFVGLANISLFMRYITDVESVNGVPTNTIPENDFVTNNQNYKRCIPYKNEDCFNFNYALSDESTIYGKGYNGKYFTQPYTWAYVYYYMTGRNSWNYISLWFTPPVFDAVQESLMWSDIRLNDAFPIYSCIQKLIQQIAPNVTHEGTTQYSEFLYGQPNVVSGYSFTLFLTPKTNILSSYYKIPAQTAKITLRSIFDMLRDTFRCYWFVENGRLRIEHISFFQNGGSYEGNNRQISIDATQIVNARTGKTWAFGTNKWTYDKEEIPERYEFSWGDDTTENFAGNPIIVKSNFVSKGNIKEITISDYNPDVDLMLLNPSAMNKDGFALLAATGTSGNYTLPIARFNIGTQEFRLQNGYVAFYVLQPLYYIYDLPAKIVEINGIETTARNTTKNKIQDITLPVGVDDPETKNLIKTGLGLGVINELSINLQSRMAEIELSYETN